ncbi:MAG: DUF2970 domain-containing protein [Gammaproteobacteria bacterium]|jgi:hypothetical protein
MSETKPSLMDSAKSVLSAFFGVQSNRNRERDFTQGNPMHFIVLGFVAVLVFILLVWGAVKLVLYLAGVS